MNEYVNKYLSYINSLKEEYASYMATLKSQDRVDEAILYKVRINICDIFTVLAGSTDKRIASMKLSDEGEIIKAYNNQYLKLFEEIPSNWITNLEKAKKFNDAVTIKTEEVKLETMQILKNKFIELADDAILSTRMEV